MKKLDVLVLMVACVIFIGKVAVKKLDEQSAIYRI